jgi:hypothetical protein
MWPCVGASWLEPSSWPGEGREMVGLAPLGQGERKNMWGTGKVGLGGEDQQLTEISTGVTMGSYHRWYLTILHIYIYIYTIFFYFSETC